MDEKSMTQFFNKAIDKLDKKYSNSIRLSDPYTLNHKKRNSLPELGL